MKTQAEIYATMRKLLSDAFANRESMNTWWWASVRESLEYAAECDLQLEAPPCK